MKRLFTTGMVLGALSIGQFSISQTARIEGSILTQNSENDIRAGGNEIVIRLNGADWDLRVGGDNKQTKALINSFFPVESKEWNKVTKSLDYSMVTRLDDATTSILLPPVPAYNISSDETVE